MGDIEFWYEFGSTYSYPAVMRIEKLAAQAGVELRWRPFLLGPIFQTLGWNDSPFNIFAAKGRYMWRDLTRICEAEGIPLKLPPAKFPQSARACAPGGGRRTKLRTRCPPHPSRHATCAGLRRARSRRKALSAQGERRVSRSARHRSLARCLTLALFSCPQAAMMSRPRGERTGLA